MDNELELLRDVARAAAAFVRAQQVYVEFMLPHAGKPEGQWGMDVVKGAARLAATTTEREEELARALDRLAEVSPGLVNG
jgi:hypothetical protein